MEKVVGGRLKGKEERMEEMFHSLMGERIARARVKSIVRENDL